METLVTFDKRDIVAFASSFIPQPSVVLGNMGGIGRGCPKAIQNENTSDVIAPIMAPLSVADSVPIPSVKTPNNGPPTTPKIVKPAFITKNIYY